MRSTSDILQESRKYVQQTVSDLTKRFPCGKCGHLMRENVKHDDEACIGCDCTHCGCELLFHWKCVNYEPHDPNEFDEDVPWYCNGCVRNCDITY